MAHEVKVHAKKTIDTLYGWLFDGPSYDPFSSASSATACVKNYEGLGSCGTGAGADANGGAGGFFGGYAEKLQDKVAAVVSTASSVAANAAASCISAVAGNGNSAAGGVGSSSTGRTQHVASHVTSTLPTTGGRSSSSSSSAGSEGDNSLLSTLQSLTHPEFWQQFSPSSVVDRVVDEVQTRFGLNHWAETLNLEPRILLMLLLLPLFLLFLTTCLCMGAGHSSEEDRPHYSGQKTDPARVGGNGSKQGQGSSSSSKQGGTSSSTFSSARKGGKNRRNSKKSEAQENAGLNQSEANKDKLTAKEGSGSGHGASGDVAESHPAQTLANESAQSSRHGSVVHGEGIVSTIMEDIVGQSDAQQEQTEIGMDNREEYVNEETEAAAAAEKDGSESLDKEHRPFIDRSKATKSNTSTSGDDSPSWKPMAELHETNSDYLESHQHIFAPGTQQFQQENKSTGAGPGAAGPGSDSLGSQTMRTRSPRAYSFKEADRHRHQPHISSHSRAFGETEGSSSSSRRHHEQRAQQSGFASKMMDFAQDSPVWKNLDGISGGVLGATLATVAMLTNTVEAATSTLKGYMPQSWAELSEELKDSFDEALNQGVEGSGIDQDEGWGLARNQALNSSLAPSSSSTTARPSVVASASVTPSAAKKGKVSTASSSTSARASNASSKTSKEPAMAANAPRLRQRSVTQVQPGSTIAADSAFSSPASADTGKARTVNAKSNPTTTSKTLAPAPVAASKSASQSKLSVEDISATRSAPLFGQKSKANVNAKDEGSEPGSATPTLSSTQHHTGGILGAGQAGTTSEKAMDNIAEITHVASSPQKISHKSPTQIQKATGEAKKAVNSALKKADHVVRKAAEDSKHVAHDASQAISKARNSAAQKADGTVKQASGAISKVDSAVKHVVHDAKAIAEQIVDQTKEDLQSTVQAASRIKKAAVRDMRAMSSNVDDAAQQAAEEAEAIISRAIDQGQSNVKAAVQGAQGAVAKGEAVLQSTAHDAKKNAKSALGLAQEVAGAVVKDMVGTVEGAEELILQVAHVAQNTLGKTIHQAIETADGAVESAQKAKKNTVTAVQSTVSSIEGTVSGAVQAVPKAVHDAETAVFNAAQQSTDAAARSIHKSAHDAREAAESAVAKAKETIGSAVGAAQKAKETLGSAVGVAQKTKDAVVLGAQETVKQAESAAKSVAQGARKSVDGAIGSAYQAKDAAVHRASQAAQGAVHQARANVDSVVGAAKNAIVQNVVTPVRQAEQMIGTAVEIGRGTVEAAIQGAREASEKLEQESKRAATKSSKAAKTTMDNALATAHKKEDHVAKTLKSVATKAETTARKAGHDAKSVLDSALAKAHKTEESVAKNLKGATFSSSSKSRNKDHGPSKIKASPTLDHDDYVYKNKDGDRVSEEEADEDSDDSEEDDDSKRAGGSSIFGSAPSILHQAKVAAGAIVAKVADVGYENYDSAKHTIEDIVDNFTENIAGHEEPEENEQDDDENQSDSLSHVSTQSFKGQPAQTGAGKSNASICAPKKAASESPSKSSGSASSPATYASRTVFGAAQHAVSDATDSLADVADNVSEMITGAKSSVSKAVKGVKEIAAEAISRGNSPTQANAQVPTLARTPSPSTLSSLAHSAVHSHVASSSVHVRATGQAHKSHVHHKSSASPVATQLGTTTGHPQTPQSSAKLTSSANKEKSGADRNPKAGGNKTGKKQNQSPTKKNLPKNNTTSKLAAATSNGNKTQESDPDSDLKESNLAVATSHSVTKIPEEHAYKPNLRSQHYDKDGFIIVEDPDLVQEIGEKNAPSSSSFFVGQVEQHATAQKKLQPKDPKHLHIDTPAVSRPDSAASHRSNGCSVHHTSTEPGLSYSGAVQLNVEENDHGAVIGVSQVLISGPPQPLPHSQATHVQDQHQHNSLFSRDIFVVAPAAHHSHHHHHHDPAHGEEVGHLNESLLSHSSQHEPASDKKKSLSSLVQHVIHPHDAREPRLHHAGEAGAGAPATATPSFEQSRGESQRVIGKKGNRTKKKGKKHGITHDPQQEFTVDQHGNKVPVVDAARRDSGFDLLM